MFKKNKVWLLIATALLVTACGGGGGGSDNKDPVVEGESSGVDGGSINNPGNKPPANNPPDNNPVVDQRLSGSLHLDANQLPYIEAGRNKDRDPTWPNLPYNGATLESFEEGWGSSKVPMAIADGGTESDKDSRVPPEVYAPAAPIASIGFRVNFQTYNDAGTAQSGSKTAIGRVAFRFTERADSPYIELGQVPERMSFVIDGVELKTDDSGNLTSAKVLNGAQIHLSAVTATGAEIHEDIPIQENCADRCPVRLMSLDQVLDGFDTVHNVVLLMDLERAFSRAGEKLTPQQINQLEQLKGLFDVDITMSPVSKIVRPANPQDGLLRRELIGKPIQVDNQPPVNGAGVSIKLMVRGS